ncbi:MAG: hypothetical protein OER21_16830, partial [Gemmatimonadota bacterium]|nr:hypothetical protein [Gemmatimonadota bacterium]
VTLLGGVASPVVAQQPLPPPGEPIRNPAWQPSAAADQCLVLPWPAPRSTRSDRLLSESCVISERGTLPDADGTPWVWSLSRRVLVYGPTPDTDPRDRDFFPDTLVEAELVLFVADRDRIRPVWHDRSDLETEILRAPHALQVGTGDPLFVHRRCLSGTGGCLDHPYRLARDGRVVPMVPRYRATMRERLPAEWGFWKGVWLDPDRAAAEAPVYLPGDGNCCSSFLAVAFLRRSGDTLATDTVAVTPNPESDTWVVRPGERFGPLDAETSEAMLRRRLGQGAVTPAEVYLAEGFCTAGTRLFAGTAAEVDIGWTTAARDRPAFVRTRRADGPWRTPAGVRVGITLAELERLGGAPLTFSGFGWDYGGGTSWQEGTGAVGLHLSPDTASDRIIADLAAHDPRVNELFGDRPVRSDHPIVRQLRIVVEELGMGWGATADEHDCR